MIRQALIVGINDYGSFPSAPWSIDNAASLLEAIETNSNHEPNFTCSTIFGVRPFSSNIVDDAGTVTTDKVLATFESVLGLSDSSLRDMVLFYFSGNGVTIQAQPISRR